MKSLEDLCLGRMYHFFDTQHDIDGFVGMFVTQTKSKIDGRPVFNFLVRGKLESFNSWEASFLSFQEIEGA